MMVGSPNVFAIESGITQAYERLSLRALGFFLVHVGGRHYGRREPDSTMLAGAFDEVTERIADRGRHVAPFAADADAGAIADAFRGAVYGEQQDDSYFGIRLAQFSELIRDNHLDDWAAHSDEAFDDGSYILQFDVGSRVRLIAFKGDKTYHHDPTTLGETWLPADDFYGTLKEWRNAFEAEWAKAPKVREDAPA